LPNGSYGLEQVNTLFSESCKLICLACLIINANSVLQLKLLSTTNSFARAASTASGVPDDVPVKRMNLFTAVNDGMRVAMQTDETAVRRHPLS
jgi:hypothetical protein